MFEVVALVVSIVLGTAGFGSLAYVACKCAAIGIRRATDWINRTGSADYLPPGSR